ncbi:hypothetical protein GPECTOR_30g188 [Gonium pectorale]|uniref:Ion transport domain-containing protein n=1 Tax=Gonium pectorale TaxID=33097 RepID=A0A150GE89_GONPE|nr:hypothetical protein GPECTOR_30g188 [Gonium pectorale]|eukprot:KXZ48093.1 hypothetical protein GPECTOR_30g188 [Gonium pectorale]
MAAGAHVDARDKAGLTALMHAGGHGHSGAVGLLLEAGADLRSVDEELAKRRQRADAVRLLQSLSVLPSGTTTMSISGEGIKPGRALQLALSSNGESLAVYGCGGIAVTLWHLAAGTHIDIPVQTGNDVLSLSFSPDGRHLAVGRTGPPSVHDVATGGCVAQLAGGGRSLAAFSTDGRYLVCYQQHDKEGQVCVYDAGTWACVCDLPCKLVCQAAAVHCDSAVARLALVDQSGKVHVWKAPVHSAQLKQGLDNGQAAQVAVLHQVEGSIVEVVAFRPDGRLFATASSVMPNLLEACGGGVLQLWDSETGSPVLEPLHTEGTVTGVALSPDGRRLAVSGYSGVIRVYGYGCEVMEARQVRSLGLRRWFQHSNLFDLAQLGLMAVILGLHWSCRPSLELLRCLSAVLLLVLFWRLLQFSTALEKLGSLVRMVIQVTSDLRYFFIVLGFIYGGFALAIMVLGADLSGGGDDGTVSDSSSASTETATTLARLLLDSNGNSSKDGLTGSSGWNNAAGSKLRAIAGPVLLRLYTMIYGDFDTSLLEKSGASSPALSALTSVICGLYMFLVAIILLNLLIAVIGGAYGDVLRDAELHAVRDKARLIAETELLLPLCFRRRRDEALFRCQRVLVLQPAVPAGQDSVAGSESARQSQLEEMQAHLEGRLESSARETQAQLAARIEELESKQVERIEALQAQQGRLEGQLSTLLSKLSSLEELLQRAAPNDHSKVSGSREQGPVGAQGSAGSDGDGPSLSVG